MEQAAVSPRVQYIVDDDGQRTAVVLKWEDYQSLQARIPLDPDLLVGLCESELQALAEGMLSPSGQDRLDELLRHNRKGVLNDDEERELDRLLARVDSMNVLKARALRTLQQLGEAKREGHPPHQDQGQVRPAGGQRAGSDAPGLIRRRADRPARG